MTPERRLGSERDVVPMRAVVGPKADAQLLPVSVRIARRYRGHLAARKYASAVPVSGSVAICLFLLWGSRRAARVSIIASEDRVTVSNQFRTRVLPWSEIDRIELSQLPGYLGSYVPALAFRLKSGSRVKAQAVSSSRSDQEAMLTDWSRVAPSGVTVDTDVDSHRPQPFRFKRS
jgi:hypothetical protein